MANSGSTNFAVGLINLNTLNALPSLPAPIQPYDVEEGLGHRLYVTCFPYSYPDGGIMQIDANSGAFQAYLHADLGDTYGPGFLVLLTGERCSSAARGGSEMDEFNVAAGQSSFVQEERFGGNGEGLNVSHDGQLIVYPNGAGNGVPGYSTYEIPTVSIATVNGTFDVGPYPGAATFSNDDTLLHSPRHGNTGRDLPSHKKTAEFATVQLSS